MRLLLASGLSALLIICFCSTSEGFQSQVLPDVDTPTQVEKRDSSRFSDIVPIEKEVAFVVDSHTRELFITKDRGATWSEVSIKEAAGVGDVSFLNNEFGMLVDTSGQVFSFGGPSEGWKKVHSFRKFRNDTDFVFTRRLEVVGIGKAWLLETFKCFFTADGGKTWALQEQIQGSPRLLATFEDRYAWVLTQDTDDLYKLNLTSDQGESWRTFSVPYDGNDIPALGEAVDLSIIDANRGRISFADATIVETSDGGRTWRRLHSNLDDQVLLDVTWIDDQNGWKSGYHCLKPRCLARDGRPMIAKTRDGGRNWEEIELKTTDPFVSQVRFFDERIGWLAARDQVYVTVDGGSSWSKSLEIKEIQK